MRLIDFPTELLNPIFDYLPRSDQANLARVCQRFAALIKPILYADLSFYIHQVENERKDRAVDPTKQARFAQYKALYHHMFNRPELCQYVKSLSIQAGCPWNTCIDKIGCLKRWGLSEPSQFIGIFPNLQSLHSEAPPPWITLPTTSKIVRLGLHFRELHAVPLPWKNSGRQNSTLETMALYMWYPSIRMLQIECSNLRHTEDDHFNINPEQERTSPITDLRIVSTMNSLYGPAGDLAVPLRWPKMLKRLVYDLSANTNVIIRSPEASYLPCSEICEAVSLHGDSLEELGIAIGRVPYIWRSPGKWTGFTSLKRLAIPERFLVSDVGELITMNLHEVLPPQLEELQIQYLIDSENDTEQRLQLERLSNLALTKDAFMPRLKHVATWYLVTPIREPRGALVEQIRELMNGLDDLLSVFTAANIIFTWSETYAFGHTSFGYRLWEMNDWRRSLEEGCAIVDDWSNHDHDEEGLE